MIESNHKKSIDKINAPISVGELFDKISILEIKRKNISNDKFDNVNTELNLLKEIISVNDITLDKELFNQLKTVNENLWIIEDKIRKKEKLKEFDQEFINIARSVYIQNDIRSSLKRKINILFNSKIVEEKSY
tara:strand:+ start:229 stop:627 length:399 start_codon:yes stop_codon:yes gene_type:complete